MKNINKSIALVTDIPQSKKLRQRLAIATRSIRKNVNSKWLVICEEEGSMIIHFGQLSKLTALGLLKVAEDIIMDD